MWKNDKLDDVQKGLLEKNIIDISGEIDVDTAFYVREALMRLVAKGSPDIKILITSDGGHVFVGLDVYDLLRNYSGATEGVVYGFARSMAAVILQACKKRIALRHANILIHHIAKTEVSLDILRDKRRTERLRDELEKNQERMYKILVDRTGRKVGEIKRECAKDREMSAEEALEFGLIDEII